jgi:hypothetical protein
MIGLIVFALPATLVLARESMTRRDRRLLREGAEVVEMLVSAPDRGVSKELLERAECVLSSRP